MSTTATGIAAPAERVSPGARAARRSRALEEAAGAGAVLLVALALWLPRLRGPIDLRYDSGVYYILGTSLAGGRGYRLLNEPGAIEAVQYPPLLPLWVAAHQWLLGTSDPAVVAPWLRVSSCLLFLACALATYALARRFLGPALATLAAVLVAMHPQLTWLSDLLSSELPFLLVSLLFLLVVRRADAGSTRREVGAGVLAAAAFLARTAGLALLGAWVGEALLRRRWRRAALRAGLALLPVLGWQLHIARVQAGPGYAHPAYEYQRAPYLFYNVTYAENARYVDPFAPERGVASRSEVLRRVRRNLAAAPAALGHAVSASRNWTMLVVLRANAWLGRHHLPVRLPAASADLAAGLLGAGVVAGLALLAASGELLIPLYVAGSVLLIALTPWPDHFTRYLAPIGPLLTVALLVALAAARAWLARGRGPRAELAGGALTAGLVLGVLAVQAIAFRSNYARHRSGAADAATAAPTREAPRLFYFGLPWQRHAAALAWLREVVRPGEVVATSTPHWFFLRSGHPAIMPPFEADPREEQRLLEGVPVRYLVMDDLEVSLSAYAIRAVDSYPARWRLVYSSPDSLSRIYRRVDTAGSGRPR